MNAIIRTAFVLLLACGLAAGANAYTVERAEVTPDGALQAGIPVTVNAIVGFPVTAGTTFPSDDTFALFSELDEPKWRWSVVISGNENPKPDAFGKFFKITGFELEYPKESSVKLHVTLEGTVPQVNQSKNITVLRFQWLDQENKVRENGEQAITREVVDPDAVSRDLAAAQTSLDGLRAAIDSRAVQGANTTEAERMYAEADQLLKTASSGTVSEQSNAVGRVTVLIDQAEESLDRTSAQAEVDRATAQIRNVDEMLTFFKANPDLSNDPRVAAITVKRESAQQSLISARDSLDDDNFNQARIRANESAAKALEAYNDSVQLRSLYADGNSPSGNVSANPEGGGILPYVVVIAVIALIAVGVVLFQRRTRWDELG
ncbi:MAG: hypothetical protein GXY82_02155 [Methanospirillum sp.]|nr:hypothetical protein [Methanospirillum sp.]